MATKEKIVCLECFEIFSEGQIRVCTTCKEEFCYNCSVPYKGYRYCKKCNPTPLYKRIFDRFIKFLKKHNIIKDEYFNY